MDLSTARPSAAIAARRQRRGDLLLAVALAIVLSIGWAIHDWPRLSRMLLPDADDVMRLAQVRDWLAGQGINDWTQYRMAPPLGSPMHWSRVNDVGIAALILAFSPIAGRHLAEMIAVLTYPALLFAAAMYLSARIGRRLWGPAAAPVATVLTALAYPGTTVFIPGRIDHHALQAVLVQLLVLVQMRAPTWRAGLTAGGLAAVSLVIGLETVPQTATLLAVLALTWVRRGERERGRLAGFAGGLGIVTLGFLALLRPTYWTASLCDAFTPASSTGTLAVGAALGVLAGATPWLTGWRRRLIAGGVLGTIATGATLLAYPSCIRGPYGEMDPFLRAHFLPFIDEANGVFAQTLATSVLALGGVVAAAAIAAAWMLARRPRRWPVLAPVAAVVIVSAVLTLWQVRGAYIGAPLGAPVLAGVVLAARRSRWRSGAVIAAWLSSAGVAYAELPRRIVELVATPSVGEEIAVRPTTQMMCGVGDGWAQIDRYPAGVVMAGTSVAAYVIGVTHHGTIGAGYHRNNAGNMAMYRFFLSPLDRARTIGRDWHVRYVLFCPGDFDEVAVARAYPRSLAASLRARRTPDWLIRLPLHDTSMRLYRFR